MAAKDETLSASNTAFLKWLNVLSGLGVMTIYVSTTWNSHGSTNILWDYVLPCGAIILIIALNLHSFAGLADEVHDLGEALLVKQCGTAMRIPLQQIIRVNYARRRNLKCITLALSPSCNLGEQIAFQPKCGTFFSQGDAISEELALRCAAARKTTSSSL